MPKKITNGQIIEDILALAKRLNRQPTSRDYKEHGKYGHTLPAKRFGSWEAAIKAAGLIYRYQHPDYRPTDAEVIADVQRVAKDLGRPPTASEYAERGRFKPETVYRRAPVRHWWSVLVTCLGIIEDEAKKYGTRAAGGRYRTNEERLAELRHLAERLGRTPPREEAQRHGVNAGALVARFGSWAAACEAAGLGRTQSATRKGHNMSEEELLRELYRVVMLVGKFPSPKAFDQHSQVNHKTLAKHLGGGKWSGVEKRLLANRASLSVIGGAFAQTSDALGHVADPVRDFLKDASVDAVMEFFKNRNK